MNSPAAVVLVNYKGVDQAAHGSTHAKGAEEDGPHESGEEVAEAREEDDANEEHGDFENEGAEPEEEKGSQVHAPSLLSEGLVLFGRNNGLICMGLCGRHDEEFSVFVFEDVCESRFG
jgi:hypothetical protein